MEILKVREKLAKIKLESEKEEVNNFSSPKIPLVKTFESDIMQGVKDGSISKLSIIKGEMDNGVSALSVTDKSKNTKKILLVIFILIFLIAAGAGGYFYYFYINKPIAAEVQLKRYFIGDVWPGTNTDTLLKENTKDATSTESSLVIDLLNFEKVYPYLLKNENKFENIAKNNFKYSKLGDFQDAIIENIDMRIADCKEGAIIYGYVGKDKLVIANDIGVYIKVYKSLKK
jgi:hypothetical protein